LPGYVTEFVNCVSLCSVNFAGHDLQQTLCDIIEPSDEFLSKLEEKGVLLRRQRDKVLSKETVYEKNEQLFKFLLNDEDRDLLNALKETGQEFVVNFITANGGINEPMFIR
jgi:hypothetical protein